MESTSVDKQANSNETTQSIPHAICSYTVLLTQIYGLNLQNMQYQECKRVQDCKGMKLTSFVYALSIKSLDCPWIYCSIRDARTANLYETQNSQILVSVCYFWKDSWDIKKKVTVHPAISTIFSIVLLLSWSSTLSYNHHCQE